MKTIKVIELLNKIANGEEVPKKIKYDGVYYTESNYVYTSSEDDLLLPKIEYVYQLNEEVKIIEEEKKIPEKIKSNGKEFYCDNIDSWIDKEKTSAYCEYLMNKYNDLIDYLKSKEKGEQ